MGMEESQKAWECGSRGPYATPGGVQGQYPWWESKGKYPWNWRRFLNLRYEKPHFLVLYLVLNSHSQNTLYFPSRLSSMGTNQATPPVRVSGQSPLKLKAFSKSKAWKPPIPGTWSGFKQPLTKYSLLCFLSQEQTRHRQGSICKDSILLILTTKAAHIITFLFGHMC